MTNSGSLLPTSTLRFKDVVAQLLAELHSRAAESAKDPQNNIYMHHVKDPRSPDGRWVPYTFGEGRTCLYYTGRIIDSVAACNSNRATLLPLGNNQGKGPILYLDGGQVINTRKSDFCACWLIKPVPPASKIPKGKPRPVPTHEIKFEEVSVAVNGESFTYELPVLHSIAADPAEEAQPLEDEAKENQKEEAVEVVSDDEGKAEEDADADMGEAQPDVLLRARIHFDDAQLEKPQAKSVNKVRSFVTSCAVQ